MVCKSANATARADDVGFGWMSVSRCHVNLNHVLLRVEPRTKRLNVTI